MTRLEISPDRWRAGGVLLLVVSLLGCWPGRHDEDRDRVPDRVDLCPSTPQGRPVDEQGCSDIGRALARSLHALLSESLFTVGDIWVLQKLLQLRPDPELEQLIEWWRGELGSSPFRRHINPEATRVALPEDPGHGIIRFYNYVLAPFGRPESRALEFIRDLVSSQETGYVLTHQFLVIEWAGEQGLVLPEPVLALRPQLLDRIAAEHAADDRFSDLFVERTAMLLVFAEPVPAAASNWVDILLTAQLPQGNWEDLEPSTIAFDGQTTAAMHNRGHTTAWGALALAAYAQRH